MKPETVLIILIVALLIVFDSVVKLVVPVINHLVNKYKHHKDIEARRERFYKELKMAFS